MKNSNSFRPASLGMAQASRFLTGEEFGGQSRTDAMEPKRQSPMLFIPANESWSCRIDSRLRTCRKEKSMRSSKRITLLRGLAVIAVAASLLVGCNNSSPTEPKAVAATPAPPVVNAVWSVTQKVVSVSGPENCLQGLPVPGQSYQGVFQLRKSGDSIAFIFPFDIDSFFIDYAGTVAETAFTASYPGYFAPSCVNYRATQSLSGRFSEDGSHLTANEVWNWTFDSGEVKTFTFEWSASRR